jgi:16S rRNA processing protein RimM
MELEEVGYFSKTHGIKGQLVLKASRDFYFEEVKAIFIESSGSKAPYFVQEISESPKAIIIRLEEVDSLEKAKLLIGKKVFVDAKLVEEEESDDKLLGFEVIDEKHGSLGLIKSVNADGVQLLITLNFRNKEIILPLADELILEVDENKKIIRYDTPDGLIELYLE